jgi:hypothetical protein
VACRLFEIEIFVNTLKGTLDRLYFHSSASVLQFVVSATVFGVIQFCVNELSRDSCSTFLLFADVCI